MNDQFVSISDRNWFILGRARISLSNFRSGSGPILVWDQAFVALERMLGLMAVMMTSLSKIKTDYKAKVLE